MTALKILYDKHKFLKHICLCWRGGPHRQPNSTVRQFYFRCCKCIQKVYIDAWQTCHDLSEISGVPLWLINHDVQYLKPALDIMLCQPNCPPPPEGCRPPLCMTAIPSLFEKNICYITLFKFKKNCMVEEPSHLKELSWNQMCKIGLREQIFYLFCQISWPVYFFTMLSYFWRPIIKRHFVCYVNLPSIVGIY
jgi:hypothetical protein